MTGTRIGLAIGAALASLSLLAGAAPAEAAAAKAKAAAAKPAAAPDVGDPRGPTSDEPVGALAPANLAKKRTKAPFNLTGTWFVDLQNGGFRFGNPYPKLKPAAQAEIDAAGQAAKEHKSYKDYTGQCYPPGLPVIMTRVWPIAMVQLPTVVYMVAGFENSFRAIYIDGRPHSDPDVVVKSWNGESIGHWEGDTLVVDTRYFITDKHSIDNVPISDEAKIVERITLSKDGKQLKIRYIMTDPQNWEGEWISDKAWRRVDDQDITEVECTPDLNTHLPSTTSSSVIR
jgi:hypothetical protein